MKFFITFAALVAVVAASSLHKPKFMAPGIDPVFAEADQQPAFGPALVEYETPAVGPAFVEAGHQQPAFGPALVEYETPAVGPAFVEAGHEQPAFGPALVEYETPVVGPAFVDMPAPIEASPVVIGPIPDGASPLVQIIINVVGSDSPAAAPAPAPAPAPVPVEGDDVLVVDDAPVADDVLVVDSPASDVGVADLPASPLVPVAVGDLPAPPSAVVLPDILN